jgi:hypothetical protein
MTIRTRLLCPICFVGAQGRAAVFAFPSCATERERAADGRTD